MFIIHGLKIVRSHMKAFFSLSTLKFSFATEMKNEDTDDVSITCYQADTLFVDRKFSVSLQLEPDTLV